MSKPKLHLVFGPQGEKLIVTEEEARRWEAKNVETRSKPRRPRGPQGEILPCPTCGRSFDEEEQDDEEQEERE